MAITAPLDTPTMFPLTRVSALARLHSFLAESGPAYARLRNFDRGPGNHVHVSRLSVALRRRLIGEDEVVGAVLARHGMAAAEKYISEVFWRTYWKGWLEQRPSVWTGYLTALEQARIRLDVESSLKKRHQVAREGRTGIDCFDAWVEELESTGYLHNWSRMQFASIWIFTLGLPWELGADFMFERLIDADPASNTLSWRWVAGLHTAGKAYLADAERIKAMTDGRFSPKGLARHAAIPGDSVRVPAPGPVRQVKSPDPSVPTILLLTTEDLSLETVPDTGKLVISAIAMLPGKTGADQTALVDALERAKLRWPGADLLEPLEPANIGSLAASGHRQIVTGFAPVGPVAPAVDDIRQSARSQGMAFIEIQRGWDRRAWPHCNKGFFGLKEKIPALIGAMEQAA